MVSDPERQKQSCHCVDKEEHLGALPVRDFFICESVAMKAKDALERGGEKSVCNFY